MMTAREDRPWLDELNRKHECGPSLSRYRTLDLLHEGQPIHVQIPDNLNDPERLQIRATLRSGPLLALVGFHTMEDDDPVDGRGILMVARAADDGAFVVHVWHELYPWALKHLGLGEVSETS
jgi:hypothetical protein